MMTLDEYNAEWLLSAVLAEQRPAPTTAPALLAATSRSPEPNLPSAGWGRCAVCGTHHWRTFAAAAFIRPSTGDVADIFRHGEVLCVDCAALFANSHFTGGMLAIAGNYYKPLVIAKGDRPAWRDLIRSIPIGTETVAIITSNTKRRLWPNAPRSTFGPQWQVFFAVDNVERILTVEAGRLRKCLDIVEELYNAGIAKSLLGESLMAALPPPIIRKIGLRKVLEYEREIAPWRGTDELMIATYVAQKEN